MTDDDRWMNEALLEAKKAFVNDDVPIGCVIVKDERIIGRGYNRVEIDSDATAHAEILAMKDAIKCNGYKHLLDTTLYTTLEPCAMCAGAIVLARIPRIVIAACDLKAGASGSVLNITQNERLNHRCDVVNGVMQAESSDLLKFFFKKLRDKG